MLKGGIGRVGGVPVDFEDALSDLIVQGFDGVFVPFFKFLICKRTPHFTVIKYWFYRRI